MKIYNAVSVGFIASLLLLMLSGCSNRVITYTPEAAVNNEEYSTFTTTGIPLFTFEYPLDYIVINYNTMPEAPWTNLILRPAIPNSDRASIDEFPAQTFSQIEIFIMNLVPENPQANYAVNKTIVEYQELEAAGNVKDFKVIYKRKVVVSGVKGWEIKYSFINYTYTQFGFVNPRPLVGRDLCFANDDMSFEIRFISDADIINKTGKYFDHILQTFKFLEQ